jgi:hypothetical protein
MFQSIHFNLTPQRELVHLFRDNCMDKKVADRIRSAETMAAYWRMLDLFFDQPGQFAQYLLADVSMFKKIHVQYTDYERLLEYYVLLQANIKEVRNAGLLNILLSAVNVGIMDTSPSCAIG